METPKQVGPPMGKGKEIAFKVGLILASVLFCFGILEAAFRLLNIDSREKPGTQYLDFVPSLDFHKNHLHSNGPPGKSPCLFYTYKPHSVWRTAYPSNERGYFNKQNQVVYNINAQGFRGEDITQAKGEGVYRIVLLGDSFTLGEGVWLKDTYAKVLEKSLRTSCPGCEVLNFGVNGYGTEDELLLLKSQALSYKPDLVVIGFFLNDIARCDFDKFGEDLLAEKREWPLRESSCRVLCFFSKRIWDYRTSKKTTAFYLDLYRSEKHWSDLRSLLLKARDLLAHNHARLLVAVFPELKALMAKKYVFQPIHDRLEEFFREAKIDSIDLAPAFKEYGVEKLLVHPVDPHPNEIGHAIIARELQAAIARLGYIPEQCLTSSAPH